MTSCIEHFNKVTSDFSIEFFYKSPEKNVFLYFKEKDTPRNYSLNIKEFDGFVKAKKSNKMVQLKQEELIKLKKNPHLSSFAFPISFQEDLFGFLLFLTEKKEYPEIHPEILTFLKTVTIMISNSIQNFYNQKFIEKEIQKKELVTKELIKSDKELRNSKKVLFELQKSKILGETLPVIFHKLKNKLTPILGYAQILMIKIKDETINERIRKIERNADELTHLLNLLKDYFKGYETQKQNESLNNIIFKLKPYFTAIENEKKVKIELEIDSTLPDEPLNASQIEILISNLVDNAVCAIEGKRSKNGCINIRTELKKDTYRLIIKDNGIGIKKEDISKIWAPFYSNFPGKIGVGLPVCERIIINHDASLNVNSVVGEYTEFYIDFKHFKPKNEEIVHIQKTDKKKAKGKILIIDHQQYSVELMKEILSNEGDFEFTTKTNSIDALKSIKKNDFDLVILDIKIPDGNGIELYEFIMSKKGEDKIITIASYPFSEDLSRFLNENQIDCLPKPIAMMNLKNRVLEKMN